MKRTTKVLSVLLSCGLLTSMTAVTVSAEEKQKRIRVIAENNTLSAEDGAPWTGTLFDEWVNADDSSTMSSILETAFADNHCTQTGLETDFLTEVNGLTAEKGGAMGGWMLLLDDWVTDESISAFSVSNGKLENGDTIRLVYSCAWGADIGYDWSGSDTSLVSLTLNGGELNQAFQSDRYDYVINIDDGNETVSVIPQVGNKAYRAKVYLNTYTPAEPGTSYPAGMDIPVCDGDVIVIGVANSAWMQANYNNAQESIYRLSVQQEKKLPDVQVQEAESLIRSIGTVTVNSGSAISKARAFFDSLTAEQQAQVSNLGTLEEAETLFEELRKKNVVSLEELVKAYSGIAPDTAAMGSEWEIINLCGMNLMTEKVRTAYVESVRAQLEQNKSSQLSATRSTVNSGVIAALTSLGINAADFYGYDLTAPLADMEFVNQQGINGAVYALIALNSHRYPIPQIDSENQTTTEKLIETLLSAQEKDGGWTIDTWSGVDDGSDADMTAMVLQALAPYYRKDEAVTAAVDKALAFLSENQNEKGQFRSYGSYDCESSAQVLIALCALNIDAETDERFIKSGSTAYDGLISFCLDDRTFSHYADGESNAFSTTQAYTAVAALYRYRSSKTALLDLSAVTLTTYPAATPAEESSVPEDSSQNTFGQTSVQSSSAQESRPVPNIPNTVPTGDHSGSLVVLLFTALSAAVIVLTAGRKHQN